MIIGRRCLVRGRVTEPGEFLEVDGDGLRSLVAKDAELSEIFMRAFILRRPRRWSAGQASAISRLRWASRRNFRQHACACANFSRAMSIPSNYIDLDADKTSQELLDRLTSSSKKFRGHLLLHARDPEKSHDSGTRGSRRPQRRHRRIAGSRRQSSSAPDPPASPPRLRRLGRPRRLVIETEMPGGQARLQFQDRNYSRLPHRHLPVRNSAARAIAQTEKFGARMMSRTGRTARLRSPSVQGSSSTTGTRLSARAIIIATGAQYNRPQIANLTKFEGQGIYYGANAHGNRSSAKTTNLIVVGGANSAGQAAVFLSQTAGKVHMFVRSGARYPTRCSRYLVQRIEQKSQHRIALPQPKSPRSTAISISTRHLER